MLAWYTYGFYGIPIGDGVCKSLEYNGFRVLPWVDNDVNRLRFPVCWVELLPKKKAD